MAKRERNRFKSTHARTLVSVLVSACLVAVFAVVVSVGLISPKTPAPASQDQDASVEHVQPGDAAPADEGPVVYGPSGEDNPYASLEEGSYEPEVVLIGVDDAQDAEAKTAMLSQLDYVAGVVPDEEAVRAGFIRVQLTPGTNAIDATGELIDAGWHAEPNLYLYPAETPNDPYIANGNLWGLDAVDAYKAWDIQKGDDTNEPVGVAIIDTGCQLDHPDFWKGKDSTTIAASYNACDPSSDVTDDNGHGTHVAGIVSAYADNGIGVAGVSHNAKIIPIQCAPAGSNGSFDTSAINKGLQWAIDHKTEFNIKVINMSLGNSRSSSNPLDTPLNVNIRNNTLLEKMNDAYNAGILVVCAAGNDVTAKGCPQVAYYNYPSDYDSNCVGVIALTSVTEKADFSNYNMSGQRTKDISAPGVSVYSTWPTNSYVPLPGTSMASPYVAGIAALLFTAMPNATPEQVSNYLYAGATQLGGARFTETFGYGRASAYRSLQLATARPSVTKATYLDTVELNTVQSDNSTISGYEWNWTSKDTNSVEISSDASAKKTTLYAKAATGENGVTISASYPGFTTVATSGTVVIDQLDLSSNDVQISAVPDQQYNGNEKRPEVTVTYKGLTLNKDTDYTVTYSNNINATTNATVTISQGSNKNCKNMKTSTFVIDRLDLANAVIAPIDPCVHTGSAVEPTLTVTYNGVPLELDKDYTVSYDNNIDVTKSGASATITGKGNYKGTLTAHFGISADIDAATISGIPESLVYTGSALTPTVTLTKGNTVLEENVDYTVSYGNNINAGTNTATITITGIGGYSSEVVRTFSILPKSLKSSGSIASISARDYTGVAIRPPVSVYDGQTLLTENTHYTLEITNNVNVGTAQVTVTGMGNYEGELTSSFEILGKSLDNAHISIEDQVYTGQAITPAATVTIGNLELVENRDYTISFENNTQVGTARAIITGMGAYTGTANGTFRITGDISNATISVDPQSYTGSALEPTVKVTHGTATLVEGTHYTVAYSNNTRVGTATVTVTGKGDYSGSKQKTFRIFAAEITSARVTALDQIYTGSEIKPDPIVTIGNTVLTKNLDYRVTSYSYNVFPGKNTAVVNIEGIGNYTGKASGKFTILKADITTAQFNDIPLQYYMGHAVTPDPEIIYCNRRLTQGADYTLQYSGNDTIGSRKASVTITGIDSFTGSITKEFDIAYDVSVAKVEGVPKSAMYTGKAIEPDVKVLLGDLELIEGTHYELSYLNNVNASTQDERAQVLITGIGEFEGSLALGFDILPLSLNDGGSISKIQSYEYTGRPIEPPVTVYYGNTELKAGTDYDVVYANNTNEGAASVSVKGKGNYTGSLTTAFQITKRSLSKATVSASEQMYTGSALEPEVLVTLSGETLRPDVDYEVKYYNNTDAGTATVQIIGKGGWKDTASGTFRIMPANIANADIAAVPLQAYNGGAVMPTPAVTFNGKTLKPKAGLQPNDFIYSYKNNTAPGTATLTITGTGNFTGQKSMEFTISSDISMASIELAVDANNSAGEYTGNEHKPLRSVKMGDTTLTEGTDYRVEYKDNTNAGTNKASVTITGIGKYTNKVTRSFSITARSIEGGTIAPIPAQAYTGQTVTPALTVTVNGTKLTPEIDYIAVYNGKDAGTGQVSVSGKGNYTGRLQSSFEIFGTPISQAAITVPNALYTGKAVKPVATVVLNGTTLRPGTDYSVSYSNNIEVSSASAPAVITITGKGAYTGSKTANFQIRKDISKATASVSAQTYTGSALQPALTVKYGSTTLVPGTDYDVSYADNINAGTASATIIGKGTYEGSSMKTSFTIAPANIASAKIGSIPEQLHTGSALAPDPGVEFAGKKLVLNSDYALSHKNNTAPGTASVTVSGKGNFTGSAVVEFVIKKAPSSTDPANNNNNNNNSNNDNASTNPNDPGRSPVVPKVTGTWKSSADGRWWFEYDAASKPANAQSYVANATVSINGKAYHFDESGWMQTGWVKENGYWYYFDGSGEMHKGWLKDGGAWYYLAQDGRMATGWVDDSGSRYYLNASGVMQTGWLELGTTWYYLQGSGAMATGWASVNGVWYYLNTASDGGVIGAMRTGWLNLGGTWYYLQGSGAMATGWLNLGGTWYYLHGSGAMATGWLKDGGKWYYLYDSGAMARNAWVDGYWLGSDGAWA